MSLNEFLAKQGIHVEGEEQPVPLPMINGVGSMSYPNVREKNHLLRDDGLDDEDEPGIFHRDIDQVMETSPIEDTSKKRKTRGKTTCKHIHSRTLEEKGEVTFDNGQAARPNAKKVNDLTHFLGTLGRNQNFISLMYTNWRAVPKEIKKCLWNYVYVRLYYFFSLIIYSIYLTSCNVYYVLLVSPNSSFRKKERNG